MHLIRLRAASLRFAAQLQLSEYPAICDSFGCFAFAKKHRTPLLSPSPCCLTSRRQLSDEFASGNSWIHQLVVLRGPQTAKLLYQKRLSTGGVCFAAIIRFDRNQRLNRAGMIATKRFLPLLRHARMGPTHKGK